MAYNAAVSLVQILNKLLHSDQLSIPYPKSQIESLHEKVCFLKSFLKENNLEPNNRTSLVHELETQIRDAICDAEDIVESHLLPPELYENSSGDENFPHKLLQVLQQFDSIKDAASKISDDIDPGREDAGTRPSEEPFVLSRFVQENKMFVGLEDIMTELKDQLTNGATKHLDVLGVVGMVGIGKTTLVNEVYNDPSVKNHFHWRAWVSVGSRNHVREILLSLLNPECPAPEWSTEELGLCLYKMLKGKKYLIVLDDVRGIDTWNNLRRLFPNDVNRSRIIINTRLWESLPIGNIYKVRFLDENESWDLLRYAAMGKESCPVELVKIGKTIAQNCQGLPLKIIVLGSLLSRMPRDPEIWSTVADNGEIQNREMLNATQHLHHDRLPQHIEACFLYMTAFPMYRQIPVSKLLKFWIAEGFIETSKLKTSEEVAKDCLAQLDRRSLILEHESSSTRRIKTCSIHSAIWPYYERAAAEHKVFHGIGSYKEGADPTHRRFSIYKNVLFAIKDVRDSLACVSNARSLLCTGPYHPYPLRVILSFRLLRVLDALSIRCYKFPVEILKLVLLRFLAFTLNKGELPPSMSKLGELQFLIVRRHSNIKASGATSFLPIEIWNMKELMHLQVMGGDVPSPPFDHVNARLRNLLTLSDVGAISCTREVLERTPNLKKLGIRVESAWDVAHLQHVFDHLATLNRLETFKCVVMNPLVGTRPATLPCSVFPLRLKKLTLSGCGFPWEDMKEISRLPNLEVLKLRCHSFGGPKWELEEEFFNRLGFLLLEDLDIEQWVVPHCWNFTNLRHLAIHHCYKLREIPLEIGNIATLDTIDLVDCSPSAVDSAMRMKEEHEGLPNDFLKVQIYSAWTHIGSSRKI